MAASDIAMPFHAVMNPLNANNRPATNDPAVEPPILRRIKAVKNPASKILRRNPMLHASVVGRR